MSNNYGEEYKVLLSNEVEDIVDANKEKFREMLGWLDLVREEAEDYLMNYRRCTYVVGQFVGLDLSYHVIGRQACEDRRNPVTRCVYHISDGARDECEYCGLPEERK